MAFDVLCKNCGHNESDHLTHNTETGLNYAGGCCEWSAARALTSSEREELEEHNQNLRHDKIQITHSGK